MFSIPQTNYNVPLPNVIGRLTWRRSLSLSLSFSLYNFQFGKNLRLNILQLAHKFFHKVLLKEIALNCLLFFFVRRREKEKKNRFPARDWLIVSRFKIDMYGIITVLVSWSSCVHQNALHSKRDENIVERWINSKSLSQYPIDFDCTVIKCSFQFWWDNNKTERIKG